MPAKSSRGLYLPGDALSKRTLKCLSACVEIGQQVEPSPLHDRLVDGAALAGQPRHEPVHLDPERWPAAGSVDTILS